MQLHAIDVRRAAALLIVAAGIVHSSTQARAEEVTAVATPAPAVSATKERVVVVRAVTLGGVRPGEVVMLTERGVMERVSPAQVAQLPQTSTAKLNPLANCMP